MQPVPGAAFGVGGGSSAGAASRRKGEGGGGRRGQPAQDGRAVPVVGDGGEKGRYSPFSSHSLSFIILALVFFAMVTNVDEVCSTMLLVCRITRSIVFSCCMVPKASMLELPTIFRVVAPRGCS